MKNTVKRLLGVAALGACAFNASAGVITDSASFSFSSTNFYDYSYGATNNASAQRARSQYLYLDGFDSTLGALTGINIGFQSQYGLRAQVSASDIYNNWGTDYTNATVRAASTMTFDLVNPNGPTNNTYRSVMTSCSSSSYSNPSCSNASTTSASFNGAMDVSGIDFAAFLDTTVTLKIDQLLTALLTSCDSDSRCYGWNTNNQWTGDVTVAYTYSEFTAAVPEPGMLALFGLGLLGLGVSRRKTKG